MRDGEWGHCETGKDKVDELVPTRKSYRILCTISTSKVIGSTTVAYAKPGARRGSTFSRPHSRFGKAFMEIVQREVRKSMLQTHGGFWQREYYDHLIRREAGLNERSAMLGRSSLKGKIDELEMGLGVGRDAPREPAKDGGATLNRRYSWNNRLFRVLTTKLLVVATATTTVATPSCRPARGRPASALLFGQLLWRHSSVSDDSSPGRGPGDRSQR
jgi:hypothetical protein